MARLIYKFSVWVAIWRGVKKGLKKSPPRYLQDWDLLLRQYVEDVKRDFNRQAFLLFDNIDTNETRMK